MFKLKIIIFLFLFSFNCFSDNKVIINYANIAEAKYNDSLLLAEKMLGDVNNFLDNTTEDNL